MNRRANFFFGLGPARAAAEAAKSRVCRAPPRERPIASVRAA